MILCRDENIISAKFHLNSQFFENIWNVTEHADAAIFDRYLRFCHRGKTDETSNFDHVRKKCVLCATEIFNSFDSQQIRADPSYLRSHPIEHRAELLQIRFASRVINSCNSFR